MNVFISWSGKTSGELAKVLRDWLPSVIQSVKPYFSTDDIEKGTRGNTMLAQELEEASIGILCLTRENLEASWIMFEAGALSKSLDKSRVCPILFGDLSTTDLQGPLTNFQASKFSKEDMLKVLTTINKQSGETALEVTVLNNVFEKWWPELDQKVKEVLSQAPRDTMGKVRTDRELLEEILTLARQIPQLGIPHSPYRPIAKIYSERDEQILADVMRMFDIHETGYILKYLVEKGYDRHTAEEFIRTARLQKKNQRLDSPIDIRDVIKPENNNLNETGAT